MKNLKKYILTLAVILSVFMVSACNMNNIREGASKAVGAVSGAVIGNHFGGNVGAGIGAIAGAWTFDYASKEFFNYLDEREKQQAIKAAEDSLDFPNKNTVKWRSKTNKKVSGFATASALSGECRKIKHTIVKDGKQYNNTVKLCKDPYSGRMIRA